MNSSFTTAADRRQRRSSQTRERLFRAALELFAKHGFADTTVEDITNAADVGKGTFFNYFPSKDHILLAFAEMQLSKLESIIDNLRNTHEPVPQFLRTLAVRMTEEPGRNPSLMRALLLANLSSTPVRDGMRINQTRGHRLLTEFVEIGQQRGELRKDLPAGDIAHVFRQTVFGTLLIWSLYGDDSLSSRIRTAFDVLWQGLSPRDGLASAVRGVEQEARHES
ncbi:MAG TPA: TetR/AcrR family transcriptional regulator [Verrucomicrobiae bacterium]|nr:TetR/AcrR family transcriptional regulator [Verrucomicrobiae bacterium]